MKDLEKKTRRELIQIIQQFEAESAGIKPSGRFPNQKEITEWNMSHLDDKDGLTSGYWDNIKSEERIKGVEFVIKFASAPPLVEKEDKIEWLPRYSDTDEPDKMGRWARIGYYNGLQFFWIRKVQDKFSVTGNFPVSSNDGSSYSQVYNSESKAKEKAEEAFKFLLDKLKLTLPLVEKEQEIYIEAYKSFIQLSELPDSGESFMTYLNKVGYKITKQ